MLGIRRYAGVAIDLWQGESRLFARDFTAKAALPSLHDGDRQNLRHAAIDIVDESAPEAMATVKAFLDGRDHHDGQQPAGFARFGGIKRISFVLPDAARYRAFQEELFRLFPEEDT
jgi:hypothetical protein